MSISGARYQQVLKISASFFPKVIGYTIIVSEDDNKEVSRLDLEERQVVLPRWKDVQSHNVWPPYQVMHLFYGVLT